MLFNSYPFIFMFLPITLVGFFLIARISSGLAAAWLAAASLFFYGWWNPAYLGLLLVSIIFNYTMGMGITKANLANQAARKKALLVLAIVINIALLCYFKYANFFLDSINEVVDTQWTLAKIILPLGISFFTFTQITFLVDAYHGEAREYNFIHYGLFVTYFPHLIAGPILHHKEMMPQFGRPSTYRLSYENLAVGLTIFFIGMFKKVILADGISPYATPVFDAAALGHSLTFFEAWGGALAYTLQLYFDFSGYSDMAIGISLLFGVKLPLNFYSPYKAVNIIDFWRRWHMTLSRFLRDYLYIPLGGNRKGPARRYVNLLVTMLLGGLWHGAGWTFVIWGGLHGLYLVINHAWQALRRALGQDITRSTLVGRGLARTVTFLAVVVAWVFFRAVDVDAAMVMLKGMAGMTTVVMNEEWLPKIGWLWQWVASLGVRIRPDAKFAHGMEVAGIIVLLMIAWFMPNTQQIMAAFKPALDSGKFNIETRLSAWLAWSPSLKWAHFTGFIAFVVLIYMVSGNRTSEFLYFQF